jgi:hypothetical protein
MELLSMPQLNPKKHRIGNFFAAIFVSTGILVTSKGFKSIDLALELLT